MLTTPAPLLEAVFISDLHLHPTHPDISARFHRFIEWAAVHTKTLYILGDFFHAWPGDDDLDDWSRGVAERLAWLTRQGVRISYMHGNRDFLLGSHFFELSGMTLLSEPTVIELGNMKVLLVHGDRYCTKDTAHQWFRRLTRNRWFPKLFLSLPLSLRNKLVSGVRHYSESSPYNPITMDVVPAVLVKHMQAKGVKTLIHGHTHKQGLTIHEDQGQTFHRYVLSDWDDNPFPLCYNKSKGLYFIQVAALEGVSYG